MADTEVKLVQVNMQPQTIERVEKLKITLGTQNRSEIIKQSINITEYIAQALKNGNEIIIEKKDGKRERLVIPQISRP